jgi:hypothetical protein
MHIILLVEVSFLSFEFGFVEKNWKKAHKDRGRNKTLLAPFLPRSFSTATSAS